MKLGTGDHLAGFVCSPERWETLWRHRDQLLRVARARVTAEADAEDVVSEALLRGARAADVAVDELARWLTRVTVNLCADHRRDAARHSRRIQYAVRHSTPEPGPDEYVCERAVARAVAARVDLLPRRQQHVVRLRAAGADVTTIAQALDCSYKTAESLLSRARAGARAALFRPEQR